MSNYAFVNCNMIDCVTPGISFNITILVQNGKIEAIGKTAEIRAPSDYRIIDVSGKYVMPGIINAHVHLLGSGKPVKASGGGTTQNKLVKLTKTKLGRKLVDSMVKKHAETALNSGVTTMRCVGDILYSDVRLRNLIYSGKAIGPRLFVSGPFICPTGGHAQTFSNIADSPWEVRKQVRKNIFEQVDLIKICATGGVSDARKLGDAGRPEMTLEEISAACEEAHKAGLMVASHSQSTEGVKLALLGGVDTIEHGSFMDDEMIELFLHNPKSLRGYSCLIPTLFPLITIGQLDSSVTKMKQVSSENSRLVYQGMVKGINQARKAGIKVGFGTDASCPFVTHYNAWRELEYLVRYAGLTPEQAIRNATSENAKILGIDDITGTLEKGKSSDMIFIEKNPFEDLSTLAKISLVMAGNRLIENPKVNVYTEVDKILNLI